MDHIKEIIIQKFEIFPPPLAIFLMSMLPIIELRGSIPVGIGFYNLNPFVTYGLSVLGNMFPVFFILLFLQKIEALLRDKFKFVARFFDWLYERTRKRGEKQFQKWGLAALVTIVAIPLPMTGAWTGSVLALLFSVPFRKAMPLIFLGVLIAGLIVTLLTTFTKGIFV